MTVFPALVVPQVPENLANPKKIATLLLGRESPLMFYVLRMAEPQFFVVFRQIKHREEVVQSPGFQETVSKYGLTFSNSRYCKDTETLQEEDFEGYEVEDWPACLQQRREHAVKQKREGNTLKQVVKEQKQGGEQMLEQAFEGGRGHMPKHSARVAALFHASSPVKSKGVDEMTRRGRVSVGRSRPEEISACRERPYSLNDHSWKASARCYAPDYPRREQIRGRGRGRVSGGFHRQLPPRLLRRSRCETEMEELIEEPLKFQNVQAPQVGVRPRMKGDGGRSACLGEASKLKCPKAGGLEEANRLRHSKAEDRVGKTGGLKIRGQSVSTCEEEIWRREEGEKLKRLEGQVQTLKKQLEDEREEQKKFLEVLANVIKGEVPCVSLDKAENILVVEQLKAALAAVQSNETETGRKGAPAKLRDRNVNKDRNDNKLVDSNLIHERGAEEGSKVSGGWYVVEKRRRKPNSSSYHDANVPSVTPVRWVPGGRGLLPTPPALASNFHTRRNLMY